MQTAASIHPGTIIILNGASSSGKTTLLRALQETLPEPYLDAGVDRFIWMLPKRYLDRPLWDEVLGLATHAGLAGHTLFSGMHQAIAALSRSGNNVLVEPVWLRQLAELLADLPAYLVGVVCPLAVLEQRERWRKDRTLGQARAQYPVVHAHCLYDLEVDTSCHNPIECATQVVERVKNGTPEALAKIRKGYG